MRRLFYVAARNILCYYKRAGSESRMGEPNIVMLGGGAYEKERRREASDVAFHVRDFSHGVAHFYLYLQIKESTLLPL